MSTLAPQARPLTPHRSGRPGRPAATPGPAALGPPTPASRWLAFLGLVLAGYAVFGRGFAYLGVPPVFLSELALLVGLAVFLRQRRWREVLAMPTALGIVALIAWGLCRTLPYLGTHGIDALRDGVLYGYAAVAVFVAAALISRPELLPRLIGRYQRLAPWVVVIMPVVIVADLALGDAMPRWPWANIRIVDQKPGDAAVHLGAISALAVVGLLPLRSALWPLLIVATMAVLGAQSRGALLAWMVAVGLAMAARPLKGWGLRLIAIVMLAMVLGLVINPAVKMPHRDREYSARQLVDNAVSAFVSDQAGDLDNTKRWRLRWWTDIANYTLHGPYFWTGKGFGINLANDDGYQIVHDDAVRSPHNGHLTVLARAGVPGLTLWAAVHLSWLLLMLNGWFVARQARRERWVALFTVLTAFWAAMMCNASVDVYLEGPMGGLWCWTVMGIGLAAAHLQRRRPDLLDGVRFDGGKGTRA